MRVCEVGEITRGNVAHVYMDIYVGVWVVVGENDVGSVAACPVHVIAFVYSVGGVKIRRETSPSKTSLNKYDHRKNKSPGGIITCAHDTP